MLKCFGIKYVLDIYKISSDARNMNEYSLSIAWNISLANLYAYFWYCLYTKFIFCIDGYGTNMCRYMALNDSVIALEFVPFNRQEILFVQ